MQKAGLGRKAGNELPHGLLSESQDTGRILLLVSIRWVVFAEVTLGSCRLGPRAVGWQDTAGRSGTVTPGR